MSYLEKAKEKVLQEIQKEKKLSDKDRELVERFMYLIHHKKDTVSYEKAIDTLRVEARKQDNSAVLLLYEVLKLVHRQKEILEVNGSPTKYCPEEEKE